jgi:hypothetical protein
MLNKRSIIGFKGSDIEPYIQIGIHHHPYREIISFCQNIDPIGERSLSPHMFLKSCGSSPSTVDFPVKKGHFKQRLGQIHLIVL